jgi:predicted Rossmann-fold nucleotide-binding protein
VYNRLFLRGKHPGAELQDLLRFNGNLDERSTGSWNKKTAIALAEYIETRDISNGMTKQEYIDHLQASKEYLLLNAQPVFLLIFSDPDNELSNLQRERDVITDTLTRSGLMVQWEILIDCDRQTLTTTFKKKEFRNRIQFVYYSGKDMAGDFWLKDGSFTLSDFADVFDYQENIKLFISNTCRSHFFAEYTTQLGVGLSIGIEGEVDDTIAADFGVRIFELVSQGYDFMKELDDFKRPLSTYNRSSHTYKLFTASWVNAETKYSWPREDRKSDLPKVESPEIYALIIGINHYVNPNLPSLEGAVSDAMSFRECVVNENGNPEHIHVLTSLSTEQINQETIDNALIRLVSRADVESSRQKLLLVYFAGYGVDSPDGPVFLLPGWTQKLRNPCINIQSYITALANTIFHGLCIFYDLQKIFPIEVQPRSPLFKLPIGPVEQPSYMIIGNIAGGLEETYEELNIEQEIPRGIFTKELLKGLNGSAAIDEGNITFDTIRNYLNRMVPRMQPRTRPIRSTIGGNGDFIIVTGKQQPRQSVEFRFAKDYLGKTISILGQNGEVVFDIKLNTISLFLELKLGLYLMEIQEIKLKRTLEIYAQNGTQLIDLSWQFLGKWIWMAGTGFLLSEEEVRTAKAVGKFIAEQGYGLITGGWPGVDFLVSEAYYNTLESIIDMKNEEYLIQIVETGYEADFKKGVIQTVAPEQSKDISREKAFVVISIGGKGGTYEIFQYARTHNLPFIPLPHTGGDSARVYNELTNESGSNNPGIDLLSLRMLRVASDPNSYLQLLQNILDQLK